MAPVDRSPLRLSSFPRGTGAWRLDWFGDIAFPDAVQRRRQPSVFVYWSPVDEEALKEPSLLISAKTTQGGWAQKGCWTSVGILPLLRIGDVWRDGRLILRPDYELETFAELQIDAATTTLVKAGLNKDSQGFLLPLAEHPWHRQCTQSYCLEVALEDGRRLLIPCMELVRFYFGSSSKLINRLFSPPLDTDLLYTRSAFDIAKAALVLQLAEGMSGSSAADIARIERDPLALRAARLVGSSLLKGAPGSEAFFPQAVFPFEGKTTLVATGRWLPYAGVDRATYLVFSLRSCSHPFPFKSLRYEIHKPVTDGPGESILGRLTSNGRQRYAVRANRRAGDPNLIEQDPSGTLAGTTYPVREEHRFIDLVGKYIWKQKSLPNQSVSGPSKPGADVDGLSVSAPDREHRIRSVDLAIAIASPQAPPDFLQATIKRLKRLSRLEMTLLTASEHDGWTVPITMLHDADGEIDPRLFIEEVGGKSRLRRVGVFGLQAKQRRYWLLVIEANPPYWQRGAVGEGDVWEIIDRAANDFLSRFVEAGTEALPC